jgi:uncharacterized protein (TIGR03435 family)
MEHAAVKLSAAIGLFAVAAIAIAQQPGVWKEFTLAPAGKLSTPLEKTVEWTFEPAGSKVAYASCCPWLDVEGTFSHVGNDAWSLRASGVSLKSLLARVEGLPQIRIVAPEWMTSDRYAITAQVSDEYRLRLRRREESEGGPGEEVRALVRQELQERLQLKMHRELRMVPVYVVKAGEATKLGQDIDEHSGGLQAWARDGSFRVVNGNDAILLNWLQNTLKRPVSGADLPRGAYRFEVKWKAGNDRSLATSLWEQLGLALIEDKRELEFLVVEYGLKPEWR